MQKNRDKEYDELRGDLKDIKSIVQDTKEILLQQGGELSLITENVEETVDNTRNASTDIKSVMKNVNKSSMLYASLAGMAILTPVGLGLGLTGLHLGLLCSAGGVLGFGVSKK